MTKEEILETIQNDIGTKSTARNSMGCSEDNYNPYYAIGKCFTQDELNIMGEKELNDLIKLGEYLSGAFY